MNPIHKRKRGKEIMKGAVQKTVDKIIGGRKTPKYDMT